ncbi:Phosphate metabolism transcription protein [Didymosphaeria variabile]|uniref:Phosphate metabolism transcription protein n=1 Tax=Didymosphaeria variabile TaxID=1932322 RepID=A0A9W8XEU8_9PLEO|nr:Phosphate metabolism transcription protein [Didymosphaeria variabile]KAJ4347919.1 Phosphate metabolism transcription protein [Didymosphaeria variabile]
MTAFAPQPPTANASAEERPASLHDALEALERASNTPAKQRSVKTSSVVDVVCRQAFDVGLDQDSLRTVVQIVSVKTELDQTSVTTLIKNLYPAQRVPSDVVITIVGALGQGKGKPTPGSQNGFVKWLITVHEIIEDPSTLSRLYGVLFGLLDSISIRTSLCHLLSLITLRKHVKPFRIEQLLELARGLGNEPVLQGLLRVYKDYYPDIILGSTSAGRNSFPPAPDAEWRTRILAIQERAITEEDSAFEQRNGFKVARRGRARVKTSAIPDVHTFHANEAITLEGIDNVEDFVEKLERIEAPGQMVSFLTDPLLQKYVELSDSPIIVQRIQLWLSMCLEDQYNAIKEGVVDMRYLSDILNGLLKHAQYTKKLLPIVQTFLKEYLLIWDGLQNVDTILNLLSYSPIQSFAGKLRLSPLDFPLERSLLAHDVQACERLFGFYTSLFRQWSNQASPQPSRSTSSLAHSDQRALYDLAAHVATLSLSLLLSLPSNSSISIITSAILTFYEQLSTSSKPHHIPIILPPNSLIYLLTLSSSTTEFARITGIIANYRHAFSAHPAPVLKYYPEETTNSFNTALRDVYNLLWMSRALDVAPPKSMGLYCDPELRDTLHAYLTELDHEYSIQAAFNISNNPVLASMSLAAWLALENEEIEKEGYDPDAITRHEGPVSQRKLEMLRASGGVDVEWDAYRVRVLKWMEERGLKGPKDFMFSASNQLRVKFPEQA